MSTKQPLLRRAFGRPTKTRVLAMFLATGSVPLTIAAVILGWWQVAVVVIVALQALAVVALLDIRARMAPGAALQKVDAKQEALRREVGSMDDRLFSSIKQSRTQANESLRAITEAGERHERRLAASHFPGQIKQIEALLQLYERITPRAAMPPSGGWALDAANVLSLLEIVLEHRPSLILELGGGTSSVWLGYALEDLGRGRLVTVDHDPDYAESTREHLRRHRLEDWVDVRVAPLVDSGIENHETPWYDMSAFEDLTGIDLLLVDGPPKATGDASRYPAVTKLLPVLSEGAIVVLDDAGRPQEKAIAERWSEEAPGLSPMRVGAGASFLAWRLN